MAKFGNCKQLFQTWKTGSFMNGSSRMNSSQYILAVLMDHWIRSWIHTFWAHCSGWRCWLAPPEHLSILERHYTRFLKVSQYLENSFSWTPVNIWPFILDQTMNTHFLSQLQWLIVLTGTISTPFHPGKTFYHVPQGSSIPGQTVLPWTPVNILAICTGSDHE